MTSIDLGDDMSDNYDVEEEGGEFAEGTRVILMQDEEFLTLYVIVLDDDDHDVQRFRCSSQSEFESKKLELLMQLADSFEE